MESPWLHRYAILLAVCTFFLVVAGASVTSKEAGLSVPDWPLSYGQVRCSGNWCGTNTPISMIWAAVALLGITFIQVFLGIAAYFTRLQTAEQPLEMLLRTVAHVAVGALTLAASIVLAIQIRRNVRAYPVGASDSAQPAVVV